MSPVVSAAQKLRPSHDMLVRRQLAESAAATEGVLSTAEFERWWAGLQDRRLFQVDQIPFTELLGWSFHRDSGDLVHESGKFFAIQGLRITSAQSHVKQWTQPIINQPEVGILGLLVRRIDGVLHCLMQAKMEPGNINTLQVSPTVQATKSNYTGVHRGEGVRYLEYFTEPGRGRVLVDVLQSEHGTWFLHKRNRNMVVEVTDEVPDHEDFRWLTLGQLRGLLTVDDLVNMDVRTVFACLPLDQCAPWVRGATHDRFGEALAGSLDPASGSLHTNTEVLSWFTEIKTRSEIAADLVPLREIERWDRSEMEIAHEEGKYFRVVAVSARAHNREVPGWTQPLLAPCELGVIAFVVRRFQGVLHLLIRAGLEPGYLDVVELGPTVQCTPENYRDVPAHARPPFLDLVLTAHPDEFRYSAIQSEEGGRFLGARNRYLILEVEDDLLVPREYYWVTVHQLTGLLGHSQYLNVQARSLIACLHSTW